MLSLCWCVTLVFTIPPAFGVLAKTKMSALGTCVYAEKSQRFSDLLSFNGYCPLLLMATAAVVIVGRSMVSVYGRRVHAASAVSPGQAVELAGQQPQSPNLRAAVGLHSHGQTSLSHRRQKRTTKMLFLSFSFSLTCQLPLYIIPLTGLSSRMPELVLCFWILTTVQFAVTPASIRRHGTPPPSTVTCK